MKSLPTAVSFVLVATLSIFSQACIIESSSGSSGGGRGGTRGGYDDVASPSPSGVTPMLVEVDTGAKLKAEPGQGVGIFVEYEQGGIWHIFWSCDTSITGRLCNYNIQVRAASGALKDAKDEKGAPLDIQGGEISLSRSVAKNPDGITFRGEPGGIVTLEASLDGKAESVLLFFVQNDKRNGGYEGTLTNPIQFQGKTP